MKCFLKVLYMKASLRKKQQFAGMSSPYLEKVLDAGLAELASI